jgi:serine/threonine protein kinase
LTTICLVPEVFEPLRDDDPRDVGGYRLCARLGAGGMGQVFLSFLPGGRPVAVKVVRRELADDPEFRARFAVEAGAAQRVNGVHIAPLLDARPYGQPPWLATAYVPGPTLGEAVRAFGPLPPAAVRALVAEVAAALREVHAAGIVHRDLKPANVVLAADHLRVIDFGVSRAADATAATVMGVRVGSPQYMAPEQVQGNAATPATDIFALGALAYYAATGLPAFGEGQDIGVMYRVLNDDPPLHGCPPELLDLVRLCLAKDPAARPTTDALIDLCRPDGTPVPVETWLPPQVLLDIRTRVETVARLARQGPPRPPAAASPSRRRALVFAGALLVAVASAAATALVVGDSPDDKAAGDTPATASSRTATAPTPFASRSQAGTSTSTPSEQVRWRGEVRFDTDGIDLDKAPPTARMTWPVFDADLSRLNARADGPINAGDSSPEPNLALWPGPGMPTRQQCADQVATHGDGRVHIPVGRTGCLRTSKGRVAMFTVTRYPDDSFDVTAQATVWTATDS